MWFEDGDYFYTILDSQLLTVKKTRIRKGNSNGFRIIYIGNKTTKKYFRSFLPDLYEKHHSLCVNFDIPHGFIREKSVFTNALLHKEITQKNTYNLTISLDIKDFFGSIKPTHVDFLEKDLIDICFINGVLPQGLPTSPIISNIAMIKIDNLIKFNLNTIANSKGFTYVYTRYADDIVISINSDITNDFFTIKKIHLEIIKTVKSILLLNGFKINDKKTRCARFNDAVNVTGINIYADRFSPSRYTKRKLRAACHAKNLDTVIGLIDWIENIYGEGVKIP